MLENNRRGALVMTLAFTLTGFAARTAAQYLIDPPNVPMETPDQYSRVAVAFAVLAVIVGVFAWVFSRSSLVTGLGAAGFGTAGLMRWSLLGLLVGTLSGLLHAALLRWPGKENNWSSYGDSIGMVGLLFLGYWLVFRRNPMDVKAPEKSQRNISQHTTGWVLLVSSGLVAALGVVGLIISPGPLQVWNFLPLIMGSAGVCWGTAMVINTKNRLGIWLVYCGLGLAAVGLVLGVIMMFQ